MNILEFIYSLLYLLSIDIIFGLLMYILWKFLDLKYFSDFEIVKLKQENEYLRNENKKIYGSSTDFWDK